MAELTGEQWMGPASASAAAAVQPYMAWLNTTAAHAQHAAAQATASAAAFSDGVRDDGSAAEIAANRAQLAALVATNFMGVNTPAIMATEAQYGEMWAQDAAAMYGYAASSASAASLTPMSPPAPVTNPAGIAGQTAAVTQATAATGTQAGLTQLISAGPNAVSGSASPLAAAPGAGIFDIPFVANAINGGVNTPAWFAMNTIPTAVSLNHTLANAGPAAGVGAAGLLEARAETTAPEEAAQVTAMPAGMPAMATAGKGLGYGGPRYGFKPTVMPKTVLA